MSTQPARPPMLFPPLPLAEWQPTRRTLHGYAQVLGALRVALTLPAKHAFQHSLQLTAAGPTTGPLPFGRLTAEVVLDLARHQLAISSNQGFTWQQALTGQTVVEFYEAVLAGLARAGVSAAVDRQPFAAAAPGAYDRAAAARAWAALSQIDQVLRHLRAELREETGAVLLWPHGFDLALLWFSGRRVPGQDPARAGKADEQMNFGFSFGDAGLPEPYFYATAYPLPPALPATALPPGVEWYHQGWQGAVLRYAQLVSDPDPEARLLNYWRTVQRAGAALMRG